MENAPLVQASNKKNKMATTKPRAATSRTPEPTLPVKVASAGIAACLADFASFPLDTAKVRLQIQGEGASLSAGSSAARAQYRGLIGTMLMISRQEGPRALYNGLVPGLQRQMCFASIRIGFYDTVKGQYARLFQDMGFAGNGVGLRIAAGITTGACAVMIAQPTDVVKVRMQASRGKALYTGVFNAYAVIARTEGVKGLWKGLLPNVTRNSLVNCTELVSYDLIKEQILTRELLSDSLPCHFVSGTGAGFVTTVIASPVDVVKTRFMNSTTGSYRGVVHCAIIMAKQEGFKAFYKGFTPSFARIASWNVLMFVGYEQLKKMLTSPPTIPAVEIKSGSQRYI